MVVMVSNLANDLHFHNSIAQTAATQKNYSGMVDCVMAAILYINIVSLSLMSVKC